MPTLTDALKKARTDQAFAGKLLSNPEQFKTEYSLTDAQVQKLRAMKKTMSDLPEGGIYY